MARPYTSIAWRSGSCALEVELAQTLTPEAFDTVLARTSERFAATFGMGESDDVDPEALAALEDTAGDDA